MSVLQKSLPFRLAVGAAVLIAVYVAIAYLILPAAWTRYERQPGLAGRPMVTRTAQGIAGDPINVGLVGDRADVVKAMREAGWSPADAITFRTSLEIIGSAVLDRPYRDAPVSPLFYEDRREDFAFEKPDGVSADRRHHVRFWRVLEAGSEGRPVLVGSATFDRGVGFSRYTGQVTHHIGPDVDAERKLIFDDLSGAGLVEAMYRLPGSGATVDGRNGEGDPYRTDGEVWVMRLTEGAIKRGEAPVILDGPVPLSLSTFWRGLTGGGR